LDTSGGTSLRVTKQEDDMTIQQMFEQVKGGLIFRHKPGAHIELSMKDGQLVADVLLIQTTTLPTFDYHGIDADEFVEDLKAELYGAFVMPKDAHISVTGRCRVCGEVQSQECKFALPDLCIECEDGMALRDDAESNEGDESDECSEAHVG